MSTARLSLNDQLRHAFRTGALPPSPEAERSFECERRAKEVRVATGMPDTSGRGLSFYLPCEMLLQRDLSTLTSAAGANLVSPTERPFLLPILFPYSILANPALNIMCLSGLVGNVSLPIVSSSQVSGFVAQAASFQTGDMQFGQNCVLSPHLLTTTLKVSRQLIFSSGMDIMNGVIQHVLASIGAALDKAALLSDGAGSATKGVLNVTGTNSTTFGAPSAFPSLLAMQTPILQTNPRLNSVAWIGSNPTREKLMQKPKATAGVGFCWEKGANGDEIASWPAFAHSALDSSGQIVGGDWSSLVFASWGQDAIEVTVDAVTGATTNQVKIYASVMCDFAVARPAAFSISSDSAAQ
jgi:HK97 family phage major capsid protein